MAIRKNVEWCIKNKEFIGYSRVNKNGQNQENNESELVSQALVYMISGINMFIQSPIAYYFINSLNANDRVNHLKPILLELSQLEITVGAIIFDGLPANITMCKLLGANFDDDIRPFFKNPYADYNIHIIMDACHMLKLARNTLANRGVIYDNMNRKIEWNHLVELGKYSHENSFGLVHKLTKKHIDFQDRKMNVWIAVQTLSKKVANSLQFLCNNNVDKFHGVSGTIQFVSIFDSIFDIMNTFRIRNGDEIFKSAINSANKVEIFTFMKEAQIYISSLKLINPQTGKITPILKSRNKTGFLGFIVNIISITLMYEKYVDEMQWMCFFATYRLSQDHVEMFFGKIRSQNGYNDNLTIKQFKSSYRKLLHNFDVIISRGSNCSVQCHSNTLTVSSNTNKNRDENASLPEDDDLIAEFYELEQYENENCVFDHINAAAIAYVAGLVERRLLSRGCFGT